MRNAYLIIYQLLVPVVFLHQSNQLDNVRVIIVELITSAVEANHQSPIRVCRRDHGRTITVVGLLSCSSLLVESESSGASC